MLITLFLFFFAPSKLNKQMNLGVKQHALPSSLTVRPIEAGEGIEAIQCVTDPFNDVFTYNIGACAPMFIFFLSFLLLIRVGIYIKGTRSGLQASNWLIFWSQPTESTEVLVRRIQLLSSVLVVGLLVSSFRGLVTVRSHWQIWRKCSRYSIQILTTMALVFIKYCRIYSPVR